MIQSPAGLSIEIDSEERFDVREFTLEDAVSSPFQVDVVAMSDNPAVDFEELVGRDAAFHIELNAGLHPGQDRRARGRAWSPRSTRSARRKRACRHTASPWCRGSGSCPSARTAGCSSR